MKTTQDRIDYEKLQFKKIQLMLITCLNETAYYDYEEKLIEDFNKIIYNTKFEYSEDDNNFMASYKHHLNTIYSNVRDMNFNNKCLIHEFTHLIIMNLADYHKLDNSYCNHNLIFLIIYHYLHYQINGELDFIRSYDYSEDVIMRDKILSINRFEYTILSIAQNEPLNLNQLFLKALEIDEKMKEKYKDK